MKRTYFWKTWELALLIALCVTALSGLWAQKKQTEIAGQLVRLHVLAVDDSHREQEVKLQVRDRVLETLQPALAGVENREEAVTILENRLPEIQTAAETVAGDRAVHVTLSEEYYPTRVYDGFSLPAGQYTSLRVVLGEGQGHNWWCVVYPPLCTAAAADLPQTAADAGMSDDDLGLIMEENPGYVLKFRSLELWEQLRQWLGKR